MGAPGARVELDAALGAGGACCRVLKAHPQTSRGLPGAVVMTFRFLASGRSTKVTGRAGGAAATAANSGFCPGDPAVPFRPGARGAAGHGFALL